MGNTLGSQEKGDEVQVSWMGERLLLPAYYLTSPPPQREPERYQPVHARQACQREAAAEDLSLHGILL